MREIKFESRSAVGNQIRECIAVNKINAAIKTLAGFEMRTERISATPYIKWKRIDWMDHSLFNDTVATASFTLYLG